MHRRDVLKRAALGLISVGAAARGVRAVETPAPRVTPAELRTRIEGPLLSVPTCYTRDLRLDFAGMARLVQNGLRAGSRVVTLTAGNSQYDRLKYDEIKELTRFLVAEVGERALVIAATGRWPTEQAVDYARFAAARGAGGLQVTLPELPNDEAYQRHFQSIAEVNRCGIVLHGQPPLDLLRRLLAVESIVAFKEEYTTSYTLPLFREFGSRLNIFAGGEKARLLTYWPYGMRAWYSTFMTFAPAIAVRFRQHVTAGEIRAAGRLVLRYETPVFEQFSHPFWRATLEHFGIAARWMRPPGLPFTDEQMAGIRRLYDGLELRPET